MKHALLMSLMMIVCAGSAHAQLYKSVGPDGKITYSDTPPAGGAKVEVKSIAGAGGINTANLPFEVAEAVRNNPVTLFTTSSCSACDEARKLLNTRGIPFSEKTVSGSTEDLDALKRAGGNKTLPLLLVGRNKQQSFEESAWNSALTSAGYPETSKLPRTYRNPPAQAAAPAQKISDVEKPPQNQAIPANTGSLPEPIGNAPPGFRF